MGEEALKIELPKATDEASGSKAPRRRARRPPLYERIEPLRPAQEPGFNRHHELLAAIRVRNQEAHLQPQPNAPQLDPAMADQRPPEAQEAPQQPAKNPGRRQEDNWVHRRRVTQQQRVLAGRFDGNNLRNPRPAASMDHTFDHIPRPQGNGGGGVRINPVERGRVDQWRRRVVDPGDGGAL